MPHFGEFGAGSLHSLLGGLGADDHPHYALADYTRPTYWLRHPYSHLVFEEGGRYRAKPGASNLSWFSDTSLSTLVNAAILESYTQHGATHIVFKRKSTPYALDDPILMRKLTTLTGEGIGMGPVYIKLDNGVNDSMIKNQDLVNGDYGCGLENLFLDANKAGQAAGHGIEWVANGANPTLFDYSLTIKNCYVYAAKLDALNWSKCAATGTFWLKIINSKFYGADRYGWYLNCLADSYLKDCHVNGNTKNLYARFIITTDFHNNYFAGGCSEENAMIYQCRLLWFDHCRFDHPKKHAVRLVESNKSILFNGGAVTTDALLDANNTYDGIRIEDDAIDIQVHDMYIGAHPHLTPANELKYAIQELDTTDYNMYSGIDGRRVRTAALKLIGAHSKASPPIFGPAGATVV